MRCMPLITLSAVFLATSAPVQAQSANGAEFSRPYGTSVGDETRPYQGARGAGGNRVVVNGIIQTGVGVSARASATGVFNGGVSGGVSGGGNGQTGPFAQSNATAIGNQLNVVVSGRYNTVVVNSNQTNTGDITAVGAAIAAANDETAAQTRTEVRTD